MKIISRKGLMSVLLTFVMVAALLPAMSSEVSADSITKVSNEAALRAALNNTGVNKIELTADIYVRNELKVDRKVDLDLNGHDISSDSSLSDNIFRVTSTGVLDLHNSNKNGYSTLKFTKSGMYPIMVESNGGLNVYGVHVFENDYASDVTWLEISSTENKAAIAYENNVKIRLDVNISAKSIFDGKPSGEGSFNKGNVVIEGGHFKTKEMVYSDLGAQVAGVSTEGGLYNFNPVTYATAPVAFLVMNIIVPEGLYVVGKSKLSEVAGMPYKKGDYIEMLKGSFDFGNDITGEVKNSIQNDSSITVKGVTVKPGQNYEQVKAEQDAKAKKDSEDKIRSELTARINAEITAKAKLEAELKAKADTSAKASKYLEMMKVIQKSKPSILKSKSKKKKLTIRWKGVKQASGYEVLYTGKNTGKSGKKFTKTATLKNRDGAASGKPVTFTTGKLKKGGYSFKVRAFVNVEGILVYGKWSKAGKSGVK